MADFLTNLFNSIFTPGATPTLLIATNVSFAALQLILLLLLIATYSVHFLVLSGLSAGLWWSINWFVAELRVEAEKEKARKEREGTGPVDGSETEGEATAPAEVNIGGTIHSGSKEVEVVDTTGLDVKDRRGLLGTSTGKIADGSRSEASTEDEWERVDENEKDK